MPRNELFLGSLPRDVQRRDIESIFDKYGRIERCDIKNRGEGAVYAFLEFEDERDAEDALRAENGKDILGASMVVEYAKGRERRDGDRYGGGDRFGSRGGSFGGNNSSSSRGRGDLSCYECGERGHFARECRNRRGSGRNDMRRDNDRDNRDRRDNGSSRRRSRSRSRSGSPARKRSASPRRRSPSPRRRSVSPRRRSVSPRRSQSPRRRD